MAKVLWYHAVFSAYAFWLPNDPRGSWSDFVHAWELFRFGGPATPVEGKRSYAHDPHDVTRRREAKQHLNFPPARFDARCRASIARGFGRACDEGGIELLACAISYDHVHIVSARHRTKSIEAVVKQLKSFATKQMNADATHPMADFRTTTGTAPTPWGVGLWSVFISDPAQLASAIAYVERHPIKDGLGPQIHPFVRPLNSRKELDVSLE